MEFYYLNMLWPPLPRPSSLLNTAHRSTVCPVCTVCTVLRRDVQQHQRKVRYACLCMSPAAATATTTTTTTTAAEATTGNNLHRQPTKCTCCRNMSRSMRHRIHHLHLDLPATHRRPHTGGHRPHLRCQQDKALVTSIMQPGLP